MSRPEGWEPGLADADRRGRRDVIATAPDPTCTCGLDEHGGIARFAGLHLPGCPLAPEPDPPTPGCPECGAPPGAPCAAWCTTRHAR